MKGKGKGKIHLYSATIAAYAASAALSSQAGPAYSLGRSPCPRTRTLACSQSAVRSPGLPFSGLHVRVMVVVRCRGMALLIPCYLFLLY